MPRIVYLLTILASMIAGPLIAVVIVYWMAIFFHCSITISWYYQAPASFHIDPAPVPMIGPRPAVIDV